MGTRLGKLDKLSLPLEGTEHGINKDILTKRLSKRGSKVGV